MFENINQLKEIHRQQQWLAEKEKELTRPMLTDQELIPVLYQWFCKILENMDFPPLEESVAQRKKFLFIILYLYSPGALNGKQMIRGLRDKLAETLKITSRSTISDNCADLIAFYNNFREYRNDIDHIYQQLCERIREKEQTL